MPPTPTPSGKSSSTTRIGSMSPKDWCPFSPKSTSILMMGSCLRRNWLGGTCSRPWTRLCIGLKGNFNLTMRIVMGSFPLLSTSRPVVLDRSSFFFNWILLLSGSWFWILCKLMCCCLVKLDFSIFCRLLWQFSTLWYTIFYDMFVCFPMAFMIYFTSFCSRKLPFVQEKWRYYLYICFCEIFYTYIFGSYSLWCLELRHLSLYRNVDRHKLDLSLCNLWVFSFP